MTSSSLSDVAWDRKALVLATAVLYLKFLVTTMIQGSKSFAAGTRAPEDAHLPMAKGLPSEQSFSMHDSPVPMADEKRKPSPSRTSASEDEARWKRVVQNDLESIPLALVVFLVASFSGSQSNINAILTGVYTVARVLHTIVYVHARPVARMLTWMCGVATVIATAVLATIAVLN